MNTGVEAYYERQNSVFE